MPFTNAYAEPRIHDWPGANPPDPLVALEAERQRLVEAANREHDDDAIDRVTDEVIAVEERIIETPAADLAGVMVKARLMAHWHSHHGDQVEALAQSTVADIERLGAGGAS